MIKTIKSFSGYYSPKTLSFIFFLLLLGMGAFLFDDYGVTWDEPYNIGFGASQVQNVLHFFKGEPMVYTERTYEQAKTHGPVFDMLLELFRLSFTHDNSRPTLLLRHALNFLSFYLGVLAFYLLCLRRFKNHSWAFLGSLMLVLSPRIFSDAFYNSSDIPFLSGFCFAVLTLFRWLEKTSWQNLLLHTFASALAMNLRSAGILIPAFTGLMMVMNLKGRVKEAARQSLLSYLAYLLLFTALSLLMMPFLWENTWAHLIEIFRGSNQTLIRGKMLFLGRFVNITEAPWFYNPVWILITTPPFYTLGFFAGLILFLKQSFSGFKTEDARDDLIFFLWLFLPLIIPILLNSILYDAWRHHFFIYPAFILFSVRGFQGLLQGMEGKWHKTGRQIWQCAMAFSIIGILWGMIQYHPHQNVYFNFLAGEKSKISERFELDYWGSSYRKLLEYLAEKDPSPKIKIAIANFPAWVNIKIFPEAIQQRFTVNNDLKQADYFVGNFRGTPAGYPLKNEIYSVRVDGMKLAAIYKIPKQS